MPVGGDDSEVILMQSGFWVLWACSEARVL